MAVDVEGTERVVPALPPVTVPSRGELASLVRATPAFRLLHKLATWADGARITSLGELTLAEARTAVARLGLPGDQGPDREPARSAADFGELHELWGWAVAGELVYPVGQFARAGRRFAVLVEGSDDDVLDLWIALVEFQLDEWVAELDLDLDLVTALATCYRAPGGCSATDMADAAEQALSDAGWPVETSAEQHEEALIELLTSLKRLGLVVIAGDTSRCTDLGFWALRSWLTVEGVQVPPAETVGGSR